MSTIEGTKNAAGPFASTQTEAGEHARIGLDGEGAIHHYAEHESRIIVIKSGGIEHVERFDDHDYNHDDRDQFVTDWIDFIENGKEGTDNDGRGWVEKTYMTQHEFFDQGMRTGFRRLSEMLELEEEKTEVTG